jgi:hypothetical protein
MGDTAGGADGLDIEVPLKFLQPVPEALPPPQDYGHDHYVHVVDQVGGKELADSRRASSMRTSRPPAASRAIFRASVGVASMKWNVVPPFISIEGLG